MDNFPPYTNDFLVIDVPEDQDVLLDGTFYLRLLRVNTSEEQGLTLIPDKSDFVTYPSYALAVALATRDAPCAAFIAQLPDLVAEVAAPLDERAPLQERLEAEPSSCDVAVVPTEPPPATVESPLPSMLEPSNAPVISPPEICPDTQETPTAQAEARTGEVKHREDSVQAYVNRMLKHVAEPAGATPDLTSHSFRRGGAQHANRDARLAAQKVARVLSGWAADDVPAIIDVATIDHASQERLGHLQSSLFNSCTGLKQQRLKEILPTAPVVTRVEECLRAADIPVGDMLAWSHVDRLGKDQAKGSLDQEPKPKRRKKQATHLSAAWHEWYIRVTFVWDSSDRQKKTEYRHVVAFMKIFLEDSFTLVPTASDYKGQSGVLDERIAAHKRLLAIGSITDPAPADTQDILNVVGHVDYQNVALLRLLWYLFGRASDLALLRKHNISIDAGNVLFVHFIRMKTSEEQGLSLFPGTEFETCPMLAMALEMLMQTAPSTDAIDNLPDMQDQAAITLSPDVPLLDIIDHPVDTTGLGAPSAAGGEKTPTGYSHVNRVLDCIAAVYGVTAALTFHSF
ncbi:Hypothetical protein PHPALM_14830 [Phytophthora palmivora]|uniref:Uncharacterized protein n=1 Tax=Phytophthora palmivora TaxID=4796 RepID=A0A2P4XTP7_9STRA|nr:Hypothetical protein PHPALM_14830 [Phytophthora palmivora]